VLLFLLEPELLLLHPPLFRHFPGRQLLIARLFLKESGLFPRGQPLLLGNGTELLLQFTQVGFLLKNYIHTRDLDTKMTNQAMSQLPVFRINMYSTRIRIPE
jgi:hypothetical protein